jgi:hypothetical protein
MALKGFVTDNLAATYAVPARVPCLHVCALQDDRSVWSSVEMSAEVFMAAMLRPV